MLLLILGYSFAQGRLQAYLIKLGRGTQVLDVSRSNLQFQWDEKNQVAYLGFLEEYFAFYESLTKSVILIKPKQDSPLVFLNRQNPAKEE